MYKRQEESGSEFYLINDTATTDADRPLEGDLIFTPILNKLFEISFVDHDDPFHQLDNNPVYKLRCKQYEYSQEAIDTGIEELDKIEREESYSIKFTLGTGAGTFTVGEQVYQGSTGYANSSIRGEVFDWNSSTSLLTIGNIVGDKLG